MFAIPKGCAKKVVRYQARNVRRASTTQSQHTSQHPQNPQHPQHPQNTDSGKWYWPSDPTNRAAMYFVYAMLAGTAFALVIGDPFPELKVTTESKDADHK